MRVWIDLTNSPHVLVMRPVIDALRQDGHQVTVTARDFAQTLGLLELHRIPHTAIGRHRGERLGAKAAGLASRSVALMRWARREQAAARQADGAAGAFDIALGHGSNDVTIAAKLLRIPCSTMFDYEWAALQHHVNCRLAHTVVVPEAIPAERLRRYRAEGKIAAYPGLKEEYYLADFEPSEDVLGELGLDRDRPIVTVRTPPEVSLYHRFESDLFGQLLARLRDAAVSIGLQPVVLPRTERQRAELAREERFVVPRAAIDAQSLIALSDLVLSAGGTMNREAVALGVPVCSTFAGRLGAVDERLIADGRLALIRSADDLVLPAARDRSGRDAVRRVRRDPRLLLDLLLRPLADGDPTAPQRH